MSKYLKVLLSLTVALFILPLLVPVFAQVGGGGPAGVPLIEYMFARVVCVAVPLGYIVLLVVLVIAGIKYLTSGGEAKAVASAHQTITWGLLGVLFMALAWLILLLIQNFTGVEVTKFSVSSLPGVQGFSGQCLGPSPITPDSIPASVQQLPLNPSGYQSPYQIKNTNIYSSPDDPNKSIIECQEVLEQGMIVRICTLKNVCRNENDFLIQDSFNDLFTDYVKVADIKELANVLSHTKNIITTAGSIDNLTYHLKIEGTTGIQGNITAVEVAYSNNPAVSVVLDDFLNNMRFTHLKFAKFKRDEIPIENIRAKIEAVKVAITISYNQNPQAQTLAISDLLRSGLKLYGFSCDNASYFVVVAFSPLIYLYPQNTTAVSVKVQSPKTYSYLNRDQQDYWNVVARPDGTITTLNGDHHKYIDYEFLRNDFKRPINGSVIEENRLEDYLRNNLWKKLGLTDSEINDYWLDVKPRIKPSPYYFVSLIDRSEIDRVLPMEVNPKPDTILRNMTYILPLSQAPSLNIMPLEEERLKAPERKGFTVLENGVFTDGF